MSINKPQIIDAERYNYSDELSVGNNKYQCFRDNFIIRRKKDTCFKIKRLKKLKSRPSLLQKGLPCNIMLLHNDPNLKTILQSMHSNSSYLTGIGQNKNTQYS